MKKKLHLLNNWKEGFHSRVPVCTACLFSETYSPSLSNRGRGKIHFYNDMKSNLLQRLARLFKIHFTPISQTIQSVQNAHHAANHHMTLSFPAFPQRLLQMSLLCLCGKLLFLPHSYISKNTQAVLRPHVALLV